MNSRIFGSYINMISLNKYNSFMNISLQLLKKKLLSQKSSQPINTEPQKIQTTLEPEPISIPDKKQIVVSISPKKQDGGIEEKTQKKQALADKLSLLRSKFKSLIKATITKEQSTQKEQSQQILPLQNEIKIQQEKIDVVGAPVEQIRQQPIKIQSSFVQQHRIEQQLNQPKINQQSQQKHQEKHEQDVVQPNNEQQQQQQKEHSIKSQLIIDKPQEYIISHNPIDPINKIQEQIIDQAQEVVQQKEQSYKEDKEAEKIQHLQQINYANKIIQEQSKNQGQLIDQHYKIQPNPQQILEEQIVQRSQPNQQPIHQRQSQQQQQQIQRQQISNQNNHALQQVRVLNNPPQPLLEQKQQTQNKQPNVETQALNKLKLLMQRMKKMKVDPQKPKENIVAVNNQANANQNEPEKQIDKLNKSPLQIEKPNQQDDDEEECYDDQIVQQSQSLEDSNHQGDQEIIQVEQNQKDNVHLQQQMQQEEMQQKPSKKTSKENKIILKQLSLILNSTKQLKNLLINKYQYNFPSTKPNKNITDLFHQLKSKVSS